MGHGPHNNPRMLARMTHAGLQLGKEAFQQEEGYCGAHRGDAQARISGLQGVTATGKVWVTSP